MVYFSVAPAPPVPDIDLFRWDKFNHLLAYAWLTFWFGQISRRPLTRAAWALSFVLLGVGMEFVQAQGTARRFEYADMLANSLGVLAAFGAVTFGPMQGLLVKLERAVQV